MDARVDGVPITARTGKTVEINALWISALARLDAIAMKVGRSGDAWATRAEVARQAFQARFVTATGGLRDVVDGPDGDDATVRPNQTIAAALPRGPLDPATIDRVIDAVAVLVTPLGLRSLDPSDPRYTAEHRGDPATRDTAYHQGTVWPWLIGPFVEASLRVGRPTELVGALELHLAEFGLGSVSETGDGAPPHAATGCPFQAWSVAELVRARQLRRLASTGSDGSRTLRRGHGR
jgi:glycogen debranching enzyme